MKTIYVVCLLLFLTTSSIIPSVHGLEVYVVDVVWGQIASPERVVPGDENVNLVVVVANIGNRPICSLEGEILPKLNTQLPIRSWEEDKPLKAFHQSPIQPGTMAELIFRVKVLEDSAPGKYDADLKLLFRECSSTYDILPISIRVTSVTIKISPPPALRLIKTSWLVNGVERPVGPGTGMAVLRLFLEAPAETSVSNIEAFLTPPSSFKPVGEASLFETYLGRVSAGMVFTLDFPLILTDEIAVGNYTFGLALRFRNKYNTFITQLQDFIVEVVGREVVELESLQQTFSRGVYANLPLMLKNLGTASAYDVEVTLRAENPKIQVVQSSKILGSLGPGEVKEFMYQLYIDKSTEPGAYTVTATVTYRDVFGNKWFKDFKTSFIVSEKTRPGVIATASKPYILSASINNLTINYVNNNPYPLQEVKITIMASSPTLAIVEGTSTIFLYSIPQGGTYSAALKILATSQAGDTLGVLHTTVEYKDPSGVKWVESTDIALAVRADIDVRFKGVQLSPIRVRPGETVDVAGDLVNEGSNIARAVSVELLGDPPFEALGEPRAFIGLINPSQVSAFTLNFRVSQQAAAGKYVVVLRAVYKNGFGEAFTKESQLIYEVTASSTVSPTTTPAQQMVTMGSQLPLIVSVIVIILALGIFLMVRRRKREG